MSKSNSKNAQKRLDSIIKEFQNLKILMVDQENRYMSEINDLKELVKDQTEIIKENSKIRLTGRFLTLVRGSSRQIGRSWLFGHSRPEFRPFTPEV